MKMVKLRRHMNDGFLKQYENSMLYTYNVKMTRGSGGSKWIRGVAEIVPLAELIYMGDSDGTVRIDCHVFGDSRTRLNE